VCTCTVHGTDGSQASWNSCMSICLACLISHCICLCNVRVHCLIYTIHVLTLIGRAGASPPSRSAGADFYIYISIYICHPAMMVPGGPRAMRKRKAGSITSGYLANVVGVGASPCRVSWASLCLTNKPWLVYCDSRFGLPLSLNLSAFTGQLPFAASFIK